MTQQIKSGRTVAKQGVDDLVMLSKIGEDAIVDNLKKRYKADLIYTYIGPVLISVNPYRNLGNSGPEFVPLYHEHFPHENPPHLYALGEEAYRTMKGNVENQCILISGESGAGKTEAAKIIMSFISFVTGGTAEVEYVKTIVLESNPLLEAFGNAKTLRNNNSSRFGKYFEIQFDHDGNPCGGKITNYLLEKSRVVYQQNGERNFHFFYNLLAGASSQEQQRYALAGPDYFYYVNQGECYTVDGMDDREDYAAVRHAMTAVGITAQEQDQILLMVAGILHIGNVAFVDGAKGAAAVADPNTLQYASQMLQVDGRTLTNALLFRRIQTGRGAAARGSTYNVPQNVSQALGSKDAVAREIYSRMFDWIILKVNTALQAYQIPHSTVIGILDIFGFEIFNTNGFEQFCINYVNEKLQQYFIELTLKAEQEDYVREGIQWTPIQYFNNKIVCDLCDAKVGIFSVLDDICFTIHAEGGADTDMRGLDKLTGLFSSHAHYSVFKSGFQIKHYAGDVAYDIYGFSDKNKDTLFADLVACLQCSQNRFLVSLFPDQIDTGGQKKRPTTAGYKIKTSAAELMTALSLCNPHYVRCIKPNDNKRAGDWDDARTTHQVKYLGLLENVRVRRAGFAYRAPFERFLKRYKKLSPNTWGIRGEWQGGAREGSEVICRDLQLQPDQWQMGKTKIFIRHPETLFHLEELIERKDFNSAVIIQNALKLMKRARQAAKIAQIYRGNKERRRDSVGKRFQADYIKFKETQFGLQEAIKAMNGGNLPEDILFADEIMKVNRRGKPEKRFFVITPDSFFIVATAIKNKELVYNVTRKAALADITSITLSTLQDNCIVLHLPREYDNWLESDKKTEIAAVVLNQVEMLTRNRINVSFNDTITFKIKGGGSKTIKFMKNEKFATPMVSGGKVQVATGLPKDTDTAPKMADIKPFSAPGGNAMRGGGGGGGGMGMGAPRGGGGGAPRGGAAPRGGGMGGGGGGARGGGQQARALFDFTAENGDELSFRTGDTIMVNTQDGDWWTGTCNGQSGLFPGNYVELVSGGGGGAAPRGGGAPRGAPRGGGGMGAPRGGGAPMGMGAPRGGGMGSPRGAPRGGMGGPRGAPRGRGF